jgi:hypothetical protein
MNDPVHSIPGWSPRVFGSYSAHGTVYVGPFESIPRNPRRNLTPDPEVSDDRIRLTAVELYDQGLIVRWTAHSPPWEPRRKGETIEQYAKRSAEAQEAIDACGEFELEDDVGTPYEDAGVRVNPKGLGESIFVPSVPLRAMRLTLRRRNGWSTELALTEPPHSTSA